MIILGINAYHPDASVALIKDGKLIRAAAKARNRYGLTSIQEYRTLLQDD